MKKEYHDPVTGDMLTFSEMISWKVQGVIRRWAFIGTITFVTLIWWIAPGLFHDPNRVWWNYCASYMALFIESVVGIAMFAQTRRDAQIIREIRKLGRDDAAHSEKDYHVDVESNLMLKKILALIEEDKAILEPMKKND